MTSRSFHPTEPIRAKTAGAAFFLAFLAICLACGSGRAFAQTTIVDDTFFGATNITPNGGVQSAINWYAEGSGASTAVDTTDSTLWPGSNANSLFLATGGQGNRGVIGVLPSSYSLVNVGDNLTLTFDVAYNSTAENYGGGPTNQAAGMRFGLYNSNGSAVSSDGSYQTGDDYGWSGRISSGPSQTPQIAVAYQVSQSINGSNLALSGNPSSLGGGLTGSVTNINGSVGGTSYYALQLSMTLEALGQIQFTVSEGVNVTTLTQIYSVSAPASDLPSTTFNEIAIGGGGENQDFTVDNVDLTETLAAIPEPSSFGILAAGAGMLLLVRRRKN